MMKRILISLAALFAASAPAFAHIQPLAQESFASGFAHPFSGLDHILVMVAVGLWAASLGKKAMLIVPAAFVGTMGLGFAAALVGMPLPFVEPVILASVVFLGVMVALALPMPVSAVATIVAFFAVFHGYAHGGEMGQAGAANFAIGFMVATAILHAMGIALGLRIASLEAQRGKMNLTRALGAFTAAAGVWLAFAG